MRFLAWITAVIPSAAAGIAVGEAVASLGAPPPVPFASAVAVGIAAAWVLESLIATLQTARAARRG